jgi:hypothetical protein
MTTADQIRDEVDEQSNVQSTKPPEQQVPPLSSSAPAPAAVASPTSPAHSGVTYAQIHSVKGAPGCGSEDASGLGSASKMAS